MAVEGNESGVSYGVEVEFIKGRWTVRYGWWPEGPHDDFDGGLDHARDSMARAQSRGDWRGFAMRVVRRTVLVEVVE